MLPNLNLPDFATNLPSDNREVRFRPFLVKEEKILLMALEGGDPKEVENAVLRILCNCIDLTEEDVYDLPPFDVEFLFLQLRAKSVDNIVRLNLSHKDKEKCAHTTEYELDLNDIEVVVDPNHNSRILLTEDAGVVMTYPSIRNTKGLEEASKDSAVDSMFETIANTLDMVFDKDSVYEDASHQDKIEFIENLNKEQFEKIIQFYNTVPSLSHDITFTCEQCGETETITVRGLAGFFS
tara:strand:- start:1592 stop:2305 length:714 start_codon:yes stop_codon:yes gene_type:complete